MKTRQTLLGRRNRFRAALREQLAEDGWEECRVNVFRRLGSATAGD
jgi:hypothetical protein